MDIVERCAKEAFERVRNRGTPYWMAWEGAPDRLKDEYREMASVILAIASLTTTKDDAS